MEPYSLWCPHCEYGIYHFAVDADELMFDEAQVQVPVPVDYCIVCWRKHWRIHNAKYNRPMDELLALHPKDQSL